LGHYDVNVQVLTICVTAEDLRNAEIESEHYPRDCDVRHQKQTPL
jgi:hypothetical protein